jgi:hypothetical protein
VSRKNASGSSALTAARSAWRVASKRRPWWSSRLGSPSGPSLLQLNRNRTRPTGRGVRHSRTLRVRCGGKAAKGDQRTHTIPAAWRPWRPWSRSPARSGRWGLRACACGWIHRTNLPFWSTHRDLNEGLWARKKAPGPCGSGAKSTKGGGGDNLAGCGAGWQLLACQAAATIGAQQNRYAAKPV